MQKQHQQHLYNHWAIDAQISTAFAQHALNLFWIQQQGYYGLPESIFPKSGICTEETPVWLLQSPVSVCFQTQSINKIQKTDMNVSFIFLLETERCQTSREFILPCLDTYTVKERRRTVKTPLILSSNENQACCSEGGTLLNNVSI